MLPSVLARQYQEGLVDYIDTTFPIMNPVFKDSLRNMLQTPDAFFHEPYVAVRLPFRVHEGEGNLFEAIHQSYSPYVHQQKAFERLTGEDGKSTLVATGTGSGKTECFLYPILEYCYQHRGENGIKALIIYPMNALASDQAKRIAELVDGSDELKKAGIRVGMYVGGVEATSAKMMMPDHVITDKDTLLAAPPDILMTNYKMLDYLLVRPKDAELWKNNNPDTLKYIAVDELHTFDGAQGTDLACLLRRLKARLNILPGQLCCVGTSATMGSKDSADSIRHYASDVFGEVFEEDSIITEDRLSAKEFFDGYEVTDFTFPAKSQAEELKILAQGEDEEEYLRKAVAAWFDETFFYDDIMRDDTRVNIGCHLMKHNFTQSIVSEAKGNYIQAVAVIDQMVNRFPDFAQIGQENAVAVIEALYALISHARTRTASGKIRPFLNVQVQVWMRELRRMVAKVDDKDITFALAHDLNEQQLKHYLPVINCRDCGETGWTSVEDNGSIEVRDLNAFYNLFFSCDTKVRIMYPHKKNDGDLSQACRLCPECMEIFIDENRELCSNGHPTIPVWNPYLETSGRGNQKKFACPCCGSSGGLSLIGVRSATAISAGISELYASKFNDDKKLLAFTDNVQDASHHAGFYNARTWRFTMRTAVTKFSANSEIEYNLEDFTRKCTDYWLNELGTEGFVANFIPNGLTWMRAYQDMLKEGKLKQNEDSELLVDFVKKRFAYETMLEYGMSSRIGRSLEKSNCSVISFDFNEAVQRIKERIINEVGALTDSDDNLVSQIVIGFLYIMKLNGAFSSPVYDLFINKGGNDFMISTKMQRWIPGPHKGRNVPKFVAINHGVKKLGYFDEPDYKSKYGKFIDKYLPDFRSQSMPMEVSKIVIEELTNIGVLAKQEGPAEVDVWAINSKKCYVSRHVDQMVCDCCGAQISMASDNVAAAEGMFCVRTGCRGHLHAVQNTGLDFYGKLYSHGEMIRIVAREHTGLLQRDDREELERVFKKCKEDKKPWDANLLSCTPTLEMGIDIGDLSTVILSSIPPAQAQYAQRAGRGGRKDGNALTIAVANAKPHDLYFYEDPLEMIAGVVEPPKVFLQASAVLERQFTAFCMDCWVKSGKALIPKNVGACLAKLDEPTSDRFPNNFIEYVQTNLTKLRNVFTHTFAASAGMSGGLEESTIKDIYQFAVGDVQSEESMAFKIFHEFHNLKDQRKAIQDSIKDLKAMIKELESKPKDTSYDEQIKELKAEMAAWNSVVVKINEKDVFNFLSDSGLLPNYAFPEAGIVLKAVLTRMEKDEEEEGKHKFESTTYEYTRSASSAISEFAPMNSFYAGGRKLTIDQVDINTSKSEPWRLCPNCSHASLENAGAITATCPKCGSAGWADAGQVRPMMRVSMVYSNMREQDSIIEDDSDDRTSTFYNKSLLVEVDEQHDILQAYQMDNEEFSFGYEFVKNAVLREINFGEEDIVGEKMTVAGREGVSKGFRICKHCGKIQVEGEQAKHSRFCRVLKDTSNALESYEECLFLYREFKTEALRILIPATTLEATNVKVESFVAAFMLGMKSYFGNVDHLQATVSEVPIPNADYRKQYLVIYDSVPGGTGYLKQLMNDENGIVDVLQRALDIMEGCGCKDDPQKDGCYRCLYAYRQSSHIGEISRTSAINMLTAILSGKDNKKKIDNLGYVDPNRTVESELERRFLGVFEKLGTADRPIIMHKKLINEKESYSLQVGTSLWTVEPQVKFNDEKGIVVWSEPDFVLWPKKINGQPVKDHKPVAVFTDGYKYHNQIVGDDTNKRMAIALSGKYRVWSLTYKDVQTFYQDQGEYYTQTLLPGKMPSGKVYLPMVKNDNAEAVKPDKSKAFQLLVEYLANPDAESIFKTHAMAYAWSILDYSAMSNQVLYGEWNSGWKSILTAINSDKEINKFGQVIFGKWRPRQDLGNIDVYSSILTVQAALGRSAEVNVGIVIDDDKETRTDKYPEDLNGFWNFVNVMQFNPNFYFLSKTGMKDAIYTLLGNINSEEEPETTNNTEEISIDDGWNEWLDIMDDDARTCATAMMKKGIPAPTCVGYELADSKGAGIGTCEIAWEDKKIAWLLESEEEYAEAFKNAGWTVLHNDEEVTIGIFGGAVNE